jgi:hypothetical protein
MEFRIRRVILVLLSIAFFSVSIPLHAATPELKPQLTPLAYFIGDWACSGKFDANGKSIDAHQRFDVDLDGAWIIFRHDDTPPFNYHALSEWGWDATQKKFVMTVQDSFGGVRAFYSGGWNSTQLQWDGDAVGKASNPTQSFIFERVDDRHFKVSYFFLKNDAWSRMDSSTCTKQ